MSRTKQAAAAHSSRRRTIFALGFIVILVAAFLVRLVDLQVVSASEYLADAGSKGLNGSRTLYGVRGTIVDSEGQVLASSTQLYDAQIDPKVATGMQERNADGETVEIPFSRYAPDIAQVLNLETAEVEAIVDDALAENAESRFAYLKRNITTAQYVDLVDLGLPFLSYVAQPSRVYPQGAVAGNLVGYMSGDDQPLAGYELFENDCLAASNGEETYQQSSGGIRIPGTEESDPATNGGTVQLTIDSDLQWYMQEMIEEERKAKKANWGSVMVVDIETGAIKAAAESPSVDPNDRSASDEEDWGSKLFVSTFEPGSTFKAVTAAMLLDSGTSTPLSTMEVPAREVFDNGAVVNDAGLHPDYNYTLSGALVDSSNVGMSKFGDELSMSDRYDYLTKFGVGAQTDVHFGGEATGVLRPADEWDGQTRYTTTFGQGFTVTAPQVASAYQVLADGGMKMPLHIVESCTAADGTVTTPDVEEPTRVISEKAADETLEMLENSAVLGPHQLDVPGYRIGLKTGTAQKSDGNGGYKAGVYATSIVGVAPIDDPKYVVMVTLDEPKTIRSSAATESALEKALNQVMKTYRVTPSTGEPTLYPKTK